MTINVLLRDVTAGDLPIFFEQQLDKDANYMAAFTPKDPTNRDAFMTHWTKILRDEAIAIKTILCNGRVAGHILSHVGFGEPEVSYWLGKEFWGKGIATKALSAFLLQVTIRPLYARVAKDHIASIRVLEKCGFTISGQDKGFSNARGKEVEEFILKMDIELIPCSLNHIKKLIEGAAAFQAAFKLQVVDGYLPFEGALEYTLNEVQTSRIWHPWLPYLFLFRPDQAVVGLGGFKAVPDPKRTVEIGYSVAPSYQGRGLATSAARQLIGIAFASGLVDCVCAHTLAELSASTRVLEKCGMAKVSEVIDPEDGNVWKWEICTI